MKNIDLLIKITVANTGYTFGILCHPILIILILNSHLFLWDLKDIPDTSNILIHYEI